MSPVALELLRVGLQNITLGLGAYSILNLTYKGYLEAARIEHTQKWPVISFLSATFVGLATRGVTLAQELLSQPIAPLDSTNAARAFWVASVGIGAAISVAEHITARNNSSDLN